MPHKSSFLEKEPVLQLISRLSLPAIVGMIAQALYNVVDAIFLGQGVGMLAIAGVSVAFPIQMIIIATAQIIGVGGASIISRSLGERNREKAERTLGNLIGASIISSSLLAILGNTYLIPILRLFGATDAILPFASTYMRILFLGSIFFAFSIACNNTVRAEGNARFAMGTMLISAGINIVLDPIFIFTLKMGVKGAAIATIIAQASSALWLAWYYFFRKSEVRFKLMHLRPYPSILHEMVLIGFAAFVRQGAASLSLIVINRQLALWGNDAAIAAAGILSRITQFALMPIFGLVQGLLPIVGYNYGARLFYRVTTTMKLTILISTIICSIAATFMFWAPGMLLSPFTSHTDVLRIGIKASRFMSLGFPLIGFQVMASGLFQAIGKARPSLLLSMLRQVLLLVPLVLILPLLRGLQGIWIAFPLSDIFAAIITLFLYIKEVKQLEYCYTNHNKTSCHKGE